MYKAQVENVNGNRIELTGHEEQYQVVSISGISPGNAQINTSTIVGLDGAKFNSSKMNTREIGIIIRLNGDVEENRNLLYQYVPAKEKCTFYYKNDRLDVMIEGYVQSVEVDLFSVSELMQITILCPGYYFRSIEEIEKDISKRSPAFEFPFSINYDEPVIISELTPSLVTNVENPASETGAEIEILFNQDAEGIRVQNAGTGEYISLVYNFLPNDRVVIDTNKGQKSVSMLRNGVIYNIFTAVQSGSTFLQLRSGQNPMTYLVEGGNDGAADVKFKFYTKYRGV